VETSNGRRFLAAFNEIEDFFRSKLDEDKHLDFVQLERAYDAKFGLPGQYRAALRAFRILRNAMVHVRYFRGQPIAEPVPGVVDQIELLLELLKSPRCALDVIGGRDVCVALCDEPVRSVLEHVSRHDYSQFPVYDRSEYVGILTTNTIARWLGDQLTRNQGLAEEEPVRTVMRFAEEHERGLLVRRTITVQDAIDKLLHGGPGDTPATALVVTSGGRTNDTPLRVMAAFDLPELTGSLSLDSAPIRAGNRHCNAVGGEV
jgi:hypothetical protein